MPASPAPMTGAPTAGDEFRPGGWNARYIGIIIVLMLLGEVGFLQAAYPINALPEIGAHFHTSQVVWIPTIYFLVAALVSTITGTLADRFGKKRLLVFNLVLAIIGLLMSTLAPNFAILLVGRVLQAPVLTFPFLLPSLARDIFPTKTIPMAASLAVTGAGVLGIPSQFLSGPVITHLGFRAVFWLPMIVAVIALVALVALVPESAVRQKSGSIDVVGAFLLGGGVAITLLGVSFGPTWGWSSTRVILAFVVGIALVLAWLVQATRVKYPLVDLRELASGSILLTMLFAAVGSAVSSWLLVFLPIIALTPGSMGGLGLNPTHQTQLAAVFALGGFLAGWLVGFSIRRRSGGTVAIVTTILSTIGFVLAYLGRTSTPLFALATLVIGIGGAASITVAYNLAIRLVAPERQAVMSSTFSLCFNLLTSIVSVSLFAVMNSLGTTDPKTGIVAYGPNAFAAATLIPIALGGIAVLAAVALRVKLAGRDLTTTPQPAPAPALAH